MTAALITALVAYFLYNAWLPDWHGSGAFGLRRLTLLAPWCMLGLALLFDALRRRHAAAAGGSGRADGRLGNPGSDSL